MPGSLDLYRDGFPLVIKVGRARIQHLIVVWALKRCSHPFQTLAGSGVLVVWFSYLIGWTFYCLIKLDRKVHGALQNLVYMCCDLNEPCYLYVIICSFTSPRVIYDGWRSELNFIKLLRMVFDEFPSEKYALIIIGSKIGTNKGVELKFEFRGL